MENKIDNMNKTELFSEYQTEFNSLKSWVEQKTLSLEQANKIKLSLYNWIKWLKDNLSESNKEKFKKILDKLNNSNENLTNEDIETIWKIFVELEDKQIEQTDLEQLKDNIKELKSSKSKLNTLKQTVASKLTEKERKLKGLKEKVVKYKKKLKNFSVEHPIWTKALILLLPANLVVLFKKDNNPTNDTTDHKLWWQILWWAFTEIKNIFWQLENSFAQVATIFFSFFAPKEMKELLANIKADFVNVDKNILKELGGSFKDVPKTLKKYSPEKLEEWKNKLVSFMKTKWTEWLGITDNKKLEKYEKVIDKWFNSIKDDSSVKDFFTKIADGKINLDNLKLDDILAWLGVWVKWALKLISLLYEEKLISFEQIWFNLLKKWGEIVLQTALFFPKMVYSSLWKYKLEDFYDLIKNNQLSEVSKEMFLVMIYRVINQPPFSILQYIAALPGYGLSAIANAWENIKKWQIFFEALKWNKIDKQLKLLSKIEKELSGREWNIFEWIEKSLNYYRKWIAVSYAFWQAWWSEKFNINKFENILDNMWLKNDNDVSKLLKDLSEWNETTKIASFIDEMWTKIKTISTSIDYAGVTSLSENVKKALWWIFSKTNFFKEITNRLSKSLEKNANILRQPYLLASLENIFKKLKYAKTASWNVELLDLSHLTKDPQTFKDFTKDLQILAKKSPELLKFVFRNTPVVLMWKDMIDGIKEWKYTDILKTYWEFVPIVWPIVFVLWGEHNKKDLSSADLWWTAVWIWFDFWYVARNKAYNILKLSAMPIIDTAKFVWNSIDIVWRYTNWKYKTLKWLKEGEPILWKMKKIFEWGKWRVAFAAALLATLYYGYEYVSKDSKDWDKTAINVLKRLASKKWWLEVANNEIFNNWNKYDDNMKKGLIWSFIWYHLWLDPVSFENYVNDIKKDGSIFILSFNDKALNSPYLKDKLQEIRPVVRQLDKKLAVDIQVSPWNLLIV